MRVAGRDFTVPAAAAALAVLGCAAAPERASAPPVLRIAATANGYEVPSTVPSGMTHVVFSNRDRRIHEAMFVRLPDGMSAEQYVEAVKGGEAFPEGAIDRSGPGLTSPGDSLELWLRLEPGEYFLSCWYQGHMQEAPIQSLRVTADSTRGVAPPAHDAVLTLRDFQFDLAGQLVAGPQVLKIVAAGPSMHEVDLFRLEDDVTLDQFKAWRKGRDQGEGVARMMGGILDQHDWEGRPVWLRRHFEPGQYVLWCGMDMVSGMDEAGTHADAGMVHTFEVIEAGKDS